MTKAAFRRPVSLTEKRFHYCPGCHHGIIHRLVAEALDGLGLQDNTILVASVGCSVLATDYFDVNSIQSAHGRAPAVATGVKRVLPDSIVFTYQGDGDLASIGAAEILHAAARGERITVIFVNNAIYGMTGGQMAPTTLPNMKTTTSPLGRNTATAGYPLRVCEILETLPGVVYLERVSVHNIKHVLSAKKAIENAFKAQMKGLGFSLVEVLASCPNNWRLEPVDCANWIEQNMISYFPLKKFKTSEEVK